MTDSLGICINTTYFQFRDAKKKLEKLKWIHNKFVNKHK